MFGVTSVRGGGGTRVAASERLAANSCESMVAVVGEAGLRRDSTLWYVMADWWDAAAANAAAG